MTKVYIKKIDRCYQCPLYSNGYCHHRGKSGVRRRKRVNDMFHLYSWCPLPNSEDVLK